MSTYLVVWKIDIDADSPEEAARRALQIQRRPDSTATWFHVTPHCEACKDYHMQDEKIIDVQRESAHDH